MLIDLVTEGLSFSNPVSYTFEYSNTNYALLGHIISKVTGIPYQQYIKKNILEPLDMKNTYWEYDSVPKEQLVKALKKSFSQASRTLITFVMELFPKVPTEVRVTL